MTNGAFRAYSNVRMKINITASNGKTCSLGPHQSMRTGSEHENKTAATLSVGRRTARVSLPLTTQSRRRKQTLRVVSARSNRYTDKYIDGVSRSLPKASHAITIFQRSILAWMYKQDITSNQKIRLKRRDRPAARQARPMTCEKSWAPSAAQ